MDGSNDINQRSKGADTKLAAQVTPRSVLASMASRPSVDPTNSTPSIFAEILDWLLVPLLVLWPFSFVVAFVVAFNIANRPYDQALADSSRALIDQLTLVNGNVIIALPSPETNILRADEVDIITYRVSGDDGALLSGDPRVAHVPFEEDRHERNTVYYRDTMIDGQDARAAFVFTRLQNKNESINAVVQVVETKNKRNRLATEIAAFAMVLLFVAIPTAILLLWFGLTRGLRPVVSLRERFSNRLPNDLSPIDPREVPDELQPMIATLNQQLAKVRANLQVQQRFVADAAHQMRTPLAG
jgi:two-component system, OmpR family, sensor histidine kinase TctE